MAPPSPQATSIDLFHAAVVAAHEAIKQAGYVPQIFEDNFFDPVDYQHMPNSWHYYKQVGRQGLWLACAADINVLADTATENRVLNTVVAPIMRRYGVAYICPANTSITIPDHSGANQHLHCDVGIYGNTTGRDVRQAWAGHPEITSTALPAQYDSQFDGLFDTATKKALQAYLNEHDNAGLAVDGAFGPLSTKAFQRHLKTAAKLSSLIIDGVWGKATTEALQGYVGTPVDGVISCPNSTAIMAMQHRIAAGTF